MTKRIFISIFSVALAVLIISLAVIGGILSDYLNKNEVSALNEKADILAAGLNCGASSLLKSVDSENYRITLIDADGTVIFDNESDADSMENHADREEL